MDVDEDMGWVDEGMEWVDEGMGWEGLNEADEYENAGKVVDGLDVGDGRDGGGGESKGDFGTGSTGCCASSFRAHSANASSKRCSPLSAGLSVTPWEEVWGGDVASPAVPSPAARGAEINGAQGKREGEGRGKREGEGRGKREGEGRGKREGEGRGKREGDKCTFSLGRRGMHVPSLG